ncbi:hypothetical protein GCM10027443_28920 [Pontibacter brevis]
MVLKAEHGRWETPYVSFWNRYLSINRKGNVVNIKNQMFACHFERREKSEVLRDHEKKAGFSLDSQ